MPPKSPRDGFYTEGVDSAYRVERRAHGSDQTELADIFRDPEEAIEYAVRKQRHDKDHYYFVDRMIANPDDLRRLAGSLGVVPIRKGIVDQLMEE